MEIPFPFVYWEYPEMTGCIARCFGTGHRRLDIIEDRGNEENHSGHENAEVPANCCE